MLRKHISEYFDIVYKDIETDFPPLQEYQYEINNMCDDFDQMVEFCKRQEIYPGQNFIYYFLQYLEWAHIGNVKPEEWKLIKNEFYDLAWVINDEIIEEVKF